MHYYLLKWSHNAQKIRYGEMKIHLFETYDNTVASHGCHIHKNETAMSVDKFFHFPPAQYALTHWKRVLFFL